MLVEIDMEKVNQHYLDKVMDLADERQVEATEDIWDARGMKLIAKGARISRTQQEKLILHKLSKPLESSIAVEGAVNADLVVTEAQRIVDSIEPVRRLLEQAQGGIAPVDILKQIRLGQAMRMMLTILERGGTAALEHSVMVSLIAICLAKQSGLSDQDQECAALAGLLHDIGELYIEPEFLHPRRRLLPEEWHHVVVHPRIGQMLIDQLEDYPPQVARAVAEHHERFDGTGYPLQLAGSHISTIGQAVAVAEMVASVMKRDRPLERAELALRIIPGEQAPDLVSTISSALRHGQRPSAVLDAESSESVCNRPRVLFEHLASVLRQGQAMLDQPAQRSQKAKQLLWQALQRVQTLQRAYSSTGMDACLLKGDRFLEDRNREILFEVAVVIEEIEWRLREIARDIALQVMQLEKHEAWLFQPLIGTLDPGQGQ
jgi:HD-GYP domain-containing protein (c-di-GMP phosphodiesterase class II)